MFVCLPTSPADSIKTCSEDQKTFFRCSHLVNKEHTRSHSCLGRTNASAMPWSDWSDRAMVEDTLCTALRGGDGAVGTPMSRGNLEAELAQSVSWHIKLVQRASNNGKVYVGVEMVDEYGKSAVWQERHAHWHGLIQRGVRR